MQVFKTIDDLYYMLLRGLVECPPIPSRNGPMRETIGCAVGLLGTEQNFLMHPGRNLSPAYASAEVLWYLSGSHSVDMIAHYAPSYAQYAEDDGNDWAAYGHRIETNVKVMNLAVSPEPFCQNQLEIVIHQLRTQENTRQAVVTLWAPHDLLSATEGLVKSVPCTVCWQFFLRGGGLHMVTYMRSNDAWLGLPYDVYAFTTIQRMIAGTLGVPCGNYAHHVGSMHLYEKDLDKAVAILNAGPYKPVTLNLVPGGRLKADDFALKHAYPPGQGFQGLTDALKLEELSRTDPGGHPITVEPGMSLVLSDAVDCCIWRNEKRDGATTHSPLLRKAADDYYRRKRQSRKIDAGPEASGSN